MAVAKAVKVDCFNFFVKKVGLKLGFRYQYLCRYPNTN